MLKTCHQVLLEAQKKIDYLDASLLLAFVLNLERQDVLARRDQELTDSQKELFFSYVHRRSQGEALAYLLSYKDFYQSRFFVDPSVLIPRPETEELLDYGLQFLKDLKEDSKNLGPYRGLDLGTGSGCIGLSAAEETPDVFWTLSDVSSQALEITSKNKDAKNLSNVECLESFLFEKISGPWDLILTNLPYLAQDEIDRKEEFSPGEPHIALYGGHQQGLNLYEEFFDHVYFQLNDRGALFLESSSWQTALLAQFARKKGFPLVKVLPDLSGRARFVQAQKRI